jgi:hypothetical protein
MHKIYMQIYIYDYFRSLNNETKIITEMVDLESILPTLSICRYPGFKGNNSNSFLGESEHGTWKPRGAKTWECIKNKTMNKSTCIQALDNNMFNVKDFIGKLDIGKKFLSKEIFSVPLASFRPIVVDNDLVGRYKRNINK